ncbi:uncharacterized protein BX664DRAFT_257977 [Halteromyces radiatus]|uniref:uncharacterized protein n=1 Tax=Halteromyces radiatus TaxID=101107 RepID=UPI00222048AE|nr:uncharacterized protein BX664DRAFT_257977 [Halteromyces radiatus]KAI8097727.1 hypothetical protein BX664DRAFT_257977 [Halteromyces radiatus]
MPYNYEDYIPVEGAVCPICQQICSSLQTLNLHLDTTHSEEDTKGALLSWFKQAQKKVQTTLTKPGNTTSPPSSSPIFKPFSEPSFIAQFQQLTTQTRPDFFVSETERYPDTVTRTHWQHESPTGQDICYTRSCGKLLGKGNTGKQHCRRDKPINHSSLINNLEPSDSASSSNVSVSSGTLSPRSSSSSSNTNSILSMKLKYRDGEQSITKWQDDKGIKKCPICSRKIQFEESSRPLPIFQLYNQLTIARQNIEKLLPTFHSMILMLEQEKIVQQSHESYKKAAMIRKSLLDNFALYDTLVKSVKSLPAQTGSMKRLQANICIAANQYLQRNMLPLQMLPRILNTTSSHEKSKRKKNNNNNNNNKNGQQDELLIQLQAFKEQVVLVQGYIVEAKNNRKYDDVKSLTISLNELQLEIERLSKQVDS